MFLLSLVWRSGCHCPSRLKPERRTGLLRSKYVLVRIHQRTESDRRCHEDSYAAGQNSRTTDQTGNDDQRENAPPFPGHHLPAHFHCLPEVHAFVDHEREREYPGDSKIYSRQKTEHKARTGKERAHDIGQRQLREGQGEACKRIADPP